MLYIIVPYRNRKDNLTIFLNEISNFLNNVLINFKIIIVKQNNDYIFNRGILKNIGFDYVKKNFICNDEMYFCFHDVDVFPVSQIVSYYHPGKNIVHYYGETFCLGCFFFTNPDNFLKINGFPNDYWGYGMEDCTIQNRCNTMNVIIDRTHFMERYKSDRIIELGHSRFDVDVLHDNINKIKWENEINDPSLINLNGLSTLNYNIDKIKHIGNNIIKICVNFNK